MRKPLAPKCSLYSPERLELCKQNLLYTGIPMYCLSSYLVVEKCLFRSYCAEKTHFQILF